MISLLDVDNGHGRRILPWILEQADTDETAAFRVTSMSTLHGQLWDAVHNTAELAWLIENEVSRFGIHQYSEDPGDSLELPCIIMEHDKLGLFIEVFVDWAECQADPHGKHFAPPQARTILAALLPLPDGAREQAETILRGEQ